MSCDRLLAASDVHILNDGESANANESGKVATALQGESADLTADASSLNKPDDSLSQNYWLGLKTLEEQLQCLRTSVAHLDSLAKSEEAAKIGVLKTPKDQVENSENTVEFDARLENANETSVEGQASSDGAKMKASDLHKEMIRLRAKLAANNEQIRTLEGMLKSNRTAVSAETAGSQSKPRFAAIQEQAIRVKALLSARLSTKQKEMATLKTRDQESSSNLMGECERDEATLQNAIRAMTRSVDVVKLAENAAYAVELERQLDEAEEGRESTVQLRRLLAQQISWLKVKVEESKEDMNLSDS